MPNYSELMKKCIKLAKKGEGRVSPNPLAGCVILNADNKLISAGYHHKYGENHAERDALLKLKSGEEAGGTLIVNLEPCTHFGKTPPCADLIIERKIKRVVIGCGDTNPNVIGGGILKLKNAGIEVITGVMEKECRNLNKIFFTNIEEKRIYTALKTAVTMDGKISTRTGNSKWITSEKSRNFAKKLRKKYDAILTSSQTVIADNPRMVHKTKIVLDKDLKTTSDFEIYKTGHTIIAVREGLRIDFSFKSADVEFLECRISDGEIDLEDLSAKLFRKNICSVFIECGGKLGGSFIKHGLVDKIYQFISPKIMNDNSGKSCFDGDITEYISDCKNYKIDYSRKIGSDIFIEYSK